VVKFVFKTPIIEKLSNSWPRPFPLKFRPLFAYRVEVPRQFPFIRLTDGVKSATVIGPDSPGASHGADDMLHLLCLEHHITIQADAGASMNVHVGSGFTGNWFTTTKPYTHQRPSGAPPG
jgi:hypothetical protein